jgi:ElaB/YqjD/DUF883 family membrane-anchored ribosome-binding protein
MSKSDPHRAELHELAAELARPADGRRSAGDRAAGASEESHDIEALLRELQDKLSEAASDAEEVVLAHPLAAVASAFLLGLVLGRMMGRR